MARQTTKGKEVASEPAKRGQSTKSKGRDKHVVRRKLVSVTIEESTVRARKEKVVRDTFTMPRSDYEKIAMLKQRCLDQGVLVNKSELLRAGLLLLEAASQQRLRAAVSVVEKIKTGRPPKAA